MLPQRLTLLALLVFGLCGDERSASMAAVDDPPVENSSAFRGTKAGDERTIAGIKLCWCPAGRFLMGSPPDEPERRPDEDQVMVTLTRGFLMARYETTQGQ